jgi:hypothetical protein
MAEEKDVLSLKGAVSQINSLKSRVSKAEKSLRMIRDILNVHDNWHAEVSAWVGSKVLIKLSTSDVVRGKLSWIDRYNIAVNIDGDKVSIYNKGHIISIEKA